MSQPFGVPISPMAAAVKPAAATTPNAHPELGVKALVWRFGYCDDRVTIHQASNGWLWQVRVLDGTVWLDWPHREATEYPSVEIAKAAAQADFVKRIQSCLTAGAVKVEPVATHRHAKRGTEYVLIGIGKMQVENWTYDLEVRPNHFETRSADMEDIAIYRSVDDGSLWARPRDEFEDGRFAAIAFKPEGER